MPKTNSLEVDDLPQEAIKRQVVCTSDGIVRFETFSDREHVVVPVVALIGDTLIRPMGAMGTEFIPKEVLAVAPEAWHNKPIFQDHPKEQVSGDVKSSSTPEIIDGQAFGRIFNAEFEGNKLKMEAWLDPIKAAEVSPEAVQVIADVKAGKDVSVSIGATLMVSRVMGMLDGKRFDFIWRSIAPDHLAIGLSGKDGACSLEMGCGAPRLNSRSEDMADEAIDEKPVAKQSFLSRMLGLGVKAEASDEDLQKIFKIGLPEIDTAPEMPVVNQPKEEVATVTATEDTPQCSCNKGLTAQKGETMSDDTGRFGPFNEDDLNEEQVKFLSEAVEPEKVEEPVVEPDKSEAEYLATLPEGMQAMFAKYQGEEAAARADLIKDLAQAQSVFTEAQLAKEPTTQLEVYASMCKAGQPEIDYSGQGYPALLNADEDTADEVPDGYKKALEALKTN